MTTHRLLALGLLLALPAAIAARTAAAGDDPPAKTAKAADDATAANPPEVTDAAALQDDILGVIALPLAADDARDAGVDPVEVEAAITAVDAGGGSPADASDVLSAEAEATRTRGAKKGFGVWVASQVAAGKRGKELAALIHQKKAEYKAMTDEERAEVDAKLAALHDEWVDHRKQLHERRKALVAKGKAIVREGSKELAQLEKKLAKNDKRQKRIEDAIAADPSRKDELEKLLRKSERREERLEDRADKVEDRVDEAEDKLDRAEDRKEDRHDRKEDALERRDDRKEDRKEHREDHDEKKADHGKGHGKHGEGKGG
ncbi:MAG: hypothetical protein K1X88_31555 [Nannocystaceae bacterium]|nr:hypothetical protein [Nannocystaceae bacterium]